MLIPVYLTISVAILADTGFPIFYRPLRGGYHNKPFRIIKFRTMIKDADKIGGGTTALHDPRITRVGNFLRKTKLDELPQLFNIIAGTMSFVGRRPELFRYVERYEEQELDILKVRPGITDFSSIEFINLDEIVGSDNVDETYEKIILKRKNELRIKYAHEVSPTTDARILFATLKAVANKAYGYIVKKEHQ